MPYLNTALLLLVILISGLTGCASNEKQLGQSPSPLKAIKSSATPEQLLAEAIVAKEPLKGRLLLKASQLYWQSGLAGQSKATLSELDYRYLQAEDLLSYLKLRATFAELEDDTAQKESLLHLFDTSLNKLPPNLQLELINLKLITLQQLERHIEGAILLAESIGLFDSIQFEAINETIWSELKKADTSDLTQFEYPGDHYDAKGWLDLAKRFKLNLQNLDNQLKAILAWEENWPAHPALLSPPKEILVLKSLPTTQPNEVTLALPLSGPLAEVGKAIKDGFFAAYYQQQSPSAEAKKIALFDTNTQDIENIYQTTQSEKSLIVGPVDKKSLAKIAELDYLSVDTLALNQAQNNLHENLYQFSLDPESGIGQIAERFINKQYKRIAIIAPEEEWGLRIHDKFQSKLTELQGTVIESAFYTDQASLSKTVASLLATKDSNDRKRLIQKITGLKLESEPRRRRDIDAIFMIAKPQAAKSIKPLLAFHYASNIPVFASSQIHDFDSENKDLNGIQFIEMPWMLTSTDQIKNTIQTLIPDRANTYSRFYALGVDAYKLTSHLRLLSEIPGSQLEGQTGLLSMNDQKIVERQLGWAKFVRGRALPIKD